MSKYVPVRLQLLSTVRAAAGKTTGEEVAAGAVMGGILDKDMMYDKASTRISKIKDWARNLFKS